MKRILIGMLAALLTVSAQKTDEAERLMKAAQNMELVDGDMKGAIEQYRKAAQTTNRSVAAQALIRMAECYQKIGDAESKKIYERVLREYADQPEPVRQARARLGRQESNGSAMSTRQLWAGEHVDIEGQPSPDGRYQVFVDWRKKGNLAIREISSGEERLLTQDAGDHFAYWGAVFSPDGKQIAYQWCCDQIRIVNTDGSKGRVLLRDQKAYPLQPAAWSPDSKYIAALVGSTSDRVNRIVLISVADGTVTSLKTVGWAFPAIGDFSPDARYLAYSLPATKTTPGGVYAIAVNGSREITLVEGPSDFKAPAWTPDGRSIVFPSNRSGVSALWAINMKGAEPAGPPRLIKSSIGDIQPMRFTRDGSYYYGVQDRQYDIYVARVDSQPFATISQPARLSEQCIGCDAAPSWSPDGKRLAFTRTINGRASLVVRTLADGKERVLPNEFENLTAPWNRPRWLGSDALLIVDSAYSSGRRKTWRIDLTSGATRLEADNALEVWPPGDVSPDAKKLYYSVRDQTSGKIRLMRKELDSGNEKMLYEAESNGVGFFGIAVAPDNLRIAFMANVGENQRIVYVITENGGPPTSIYTGTYEDPSPQTAAWTMDSRFVVVVVRPDDSTPPRWKAIPVDGGEPVIIEPKERFERLSAPAFAPDGRSMAFGGTRRSAELWSVKNLLAHDPAEK